MFICSDRPQGQESALKMDDMRKMVMALKSEVESLKNKREQDKVTIKNLEESNRALQEANAQLQETIRELYQTQDCCPLIRCAKVLMGKA